MNDNRASFRCNRSGGIASDLANAAGGCYLFSASKPRPERMNHSSFLSGKVIKHSLPLLPVPVAPDSPNLKRLALPQGELAQFCNGPEPIRYIAYVELRPATTRGNHFHRVKQEWFYLIHGELTLALQNTDSGEFGSFEMRAGDLVVIPPGIAHAFICTSEGGAVEFSPALFDPADSYRFELKNERGTQK